MDSQSVLMRDRKGEDPETDKGKGHKEMEVEIGILQPPSQGTPRIAGSQQKRGERRDSPSEPPQRTNPASTCILDFWSPEL